MAKPLPGLGAPLQERDRQAVANDTAFAVMTLLSGIHVSEARDAGADFSGTFEAWPIIQGAIGGALNFAFQAPVDPEVLRSEVVRTVEALIPQLAMAKATKGMPGGNA